MIYIIEEGAKIKLHLTSMPYLPIYKPPSVYKPTLQKLQFCTHD